MFLFLGEINGGVHLIAEGVQDSAQVAIAIVEAVGADSVNALAVASVGYLCPVGRGIADIEVFVAAARLYLTVVVEIHQVGDSVVQIGGAELGTCRHTAVIVCQLKAVDVEHLEAVAAGGARLIMVGVSSGVLCAFANLYLKCSNVFREGVSVAHSGVVYSRVCREVHRAVFDGLLWQAAAATLNGERGLVSATVVRFFDGEGLRESALPQGDADEKQDRREGFRKGKMSVHVLLFNIIIDYSSVFCLLSSSHIVHAKKHVASQ